MKRGLRINSPTAGRSGTSELHVSSINEDPIPPGGEDGIERKAVRGLSDQFGVEGDLSVVGEQL
jgi:hypothetical protein